MFEYATGQKTDSDEDVIFVSEKPIPKPAEITFDQEKLLALQREIDQQSQPRQQHSSLTSSTVAIKRPMEVKMEEINEGSSVKKKRRHKKQQTSQPESFDPGVQKEKKGKTLNRVAKEECEKCWGESAEPEEKKKNKNFDSFPTNEEDNSVSKKKKKKKKQMMDEVVDKVENVQKCVIKDKSKKKQNKSLLIKSENTEEEEELHIGEEKIQKKDMKLKTNDHHGSIEQTEDVGRKKKRSKKETSVTIDNVTKSKRKAKREENEIKLETPEVEVQEVKLKKKTKKEEKTKESGGLEVAEINKKKNRVKDKIHNKKEDNYTEEIVIKEEKAEVKTKSKKNRCKTASMEDVQQEETEPKKKKKKASSGNKIPKAADTHSKNSKKAKVKVEPELDTEAGVKKKKKMKEEQKDSQRVSLVDVVFMSEKSGNTDEVTINQERRKALQMEVDEASQPQNPTKPVGLGQWSTAQFDSSQQQQKFLRLMGGFKTGFQPAVAASGGSSMALGKDAQQQLQQGLLGEFERAHSRRMDFGSRGAGLGFTASSNKKFSIDINASRSVRFDD